MGKTNHILIADADIETGNLLGAYLVKNGLAASTVASRTAVLEALGKAGVDLLILDETVLGDGVFGLYPELRKISEVPVIMLAPPPEGTDSGMGQDRGAQAYLPKPFIPRELLALIQGMLRRMGDPKHAVPSGMASWLRFAGWKVDTASRSLLSPDGIVFALSCPEYRVLRVLLDHPQRVLSRDEIRGLLLEGEAQPQDSRLDVDLLMSRLSYRLGGDQGASGVLVAAGGNGYVLAAAVTWG
jgi:two-component system, OmpR family, response regulator